MGFARGPPNTYYIVVLRILASSAASISTFTNPFIYLFYHRRYRQKIVSAIVRRCNSLITDVGHSSDHVDFNHEFNRSEPKSVSTIPTAVM